MLKRYRTGVKTVTAADGKVTTYTYDNMGNLTSITDANNHTTTFEYDDYRLLVKATNPLGEQRQYGYDINGNLTMVVTPNGAQIKFYNNPANVVEKKFTPEGVVTYEYNPEYNLVRAVNADSDLTFKYDLLGRLTQAEIMSGYIQPATTIDYTYDLNSNLTAVTTSNGIIRNYVYDTLNRLADITDGGGAVAHYDYDVLGRRTGKSISSNNLNTNYTYDLASQLLSLNYQPSSINFSYTNDTVGNRLSLTDTNGIHNYTYDDVYRLTNATNPSESYSYDPVGNRNPLNQNYDAGNRLLDDGTYTYTYDHNGNMLTKKDKVTLETTTYTYDSEDQLISVSSGTMTSSYKYDALGRRIEKNVAGQITRYVYDGEDIIQELDQNNQVVATYTHGPGIDEPICLEKNNEKYYYISDGLGSITAIVDQNGNVVQTYRYDSFGNIINQTGSLTQPYTYTGREYDPETGLYYYRARYYDAKIGRFLQEDPIGFAGGINLYSYVGNNPLNLIDPFGLSPGPIPSGSCGGSNSIPFIMPGTLAGAQAAQWYANQQVNSTSPFGWMWWFPGVAASAWTPQTWLPTTLTLIGGAAVAPWAAGTGPWLGTIGLHGPHHGLGNHFELIIRGIGKIFIPGRNGPIGWKGW